jgi:hypothetical protein
LVLLTLWNFILLLELRTILTFASSDASGGQIPISGVVLGQIITTMLVGWLPWLAVYRGLWELYDDGAKLERAEATEESNG